MRIEEEIQWTLIRSIVDGQSERNYPIQIKYEQYEHTYALEDSTYLVIFLRFSLVVFDQNKSFSSDEDHSKWQIKSFHLFNISSKSGFFFRNSSIQFILFFFNKKLENEMDFPKNKLIQLFISVKNIFISNPTSFISCSNHFRHFLDHLLVHNWINSPIFSSSICLRHQYPFFYFYWRNTYFLSRIKLQLFVHSCNNSYVKSDLNCIKWYWRNEYSVIYFPIRNQLWSAWEISTNLYYNDQLIKKIDRNILTTAQFHLKNRSTNKLKGKTRSID
jgi:hypothetical protein